MPLAPDARGCDAGACRRSRRPDQAGRRLAPRSWPVRPGPCAAPGRAGTAGMALAVLGPGALTWLLTRARHVGVGGNGLLYLLVVVVAAIVGGSSRP